MMLASTFITYLIARFTWRRRYPFSLLCKAGGRAPASYVFMGGFSISGAILMTSIFLAGNAIRSHQNATFAAQIVSIIADLIGIAAVAFAILMALISVYEYEALHNWMAALFTGLGIVFQWLLFGVAKSINSPDWSTTAHSIRFACAILQTVLCMAMFICMQVEKTLNSVPGNAGAGATLMSDSEPYSPSARRDKSPSPNHHLDTKLIYANVNTSLKVWTVLQYTNLTLCAIYFCTMGEFVQQYAIVLQV